MKKFLMTALVAGLAASSAHALTLKKGQVLGGDGNVYDGASPQQIEVYVKRAKEGGDAAGLAGNSVFVVIEDDITFVPIQDLAGKTKEGKLNIIGDAVVATVAGTDAVSFAQINELQDIANETGVPIDQIMKVDSALEGLSAEMAAVITDEIGALIEEGALEEVQAFLNSDVLIANLDTIASVTAQVEAELGELADDIDYYNACVAASGAATCDAIQEEMDSLPESE